MSTWGWKEFNDQFREEPWERAERLKSKRGKMMAEQADNKPDISKSQSVTDRHELIENHNKNTDIEQEETGQKSGQKLNSALHKEDNK